MGRNIDYERRHSFFVQLNVFIIETVFWIFHGKFAGCVSIVQNNWFWVLGCLVTFLIQLSIEKFVYSSGTWTHDST
uniref:Cation-transporting P-type ATPase C-terminal domain-containing protein n=1 Tax=Tetranychus urticae TaxID=32264 RepID=T1JYI8_TETUR